MDMHDSLIGRIIEGKYQILEKIGEGGMAVVYKAYQNNLERIVALKIIKESFAANEDFLKKFIREAKAMAGITHPNVVRVYDYGQDDNLYFIVMEFLEGETLDEIIRNKPKLSTEQIVHYLTPIAEALQVIHKRGLVHRDIKSANIFITTEGRSILMDFGIAYYTNKTIDLNNNLGTPEYMSPEQTKGSRLDGRSDLYGLGIVLYESLTGQLPFTGDSITAVITKVLNEKPAIPKLEDSHIPKWLQNLVIKLLEKNAEDRIASAEAVIGILKTRKSTTQIVNIPKVLKLPVLPKRKLLVVLSLAILVLVLSIFVVIFFVGQPGMGSSAPSIENLNKSQEDDIFKQAEKLFRQGDFAMAHRLYSQLLNSGEVSESAKVQKEQCVNELKKELFQDYFIGITGGSFYMGNDQGRKDEKPMHKVELNSFRIGKFEISNNQFCSFLNASGCSQDGKIAATWVFKQEINKEIVYKYSKFICAEEKSDCPVYGVTWNGANLFCRFFQGRLPTEAEWEYVASDCGMAPTKLIGVQYDQMAWHANNSGAKIHPVGTKYPNKLGIFDLDGNVWEWCQDFYLVSYYAVSQIKNPTGPAGGTTRVIRGGDCNTLPVCLQSTYRSNAGMEGNSGDYIGFRMVVQ